MDDETLVELYPSLRRFAAVVAAVEIDPDDLVQEALVRTLSREDPTSLRDVGAYLRTVILRLAANQRREFGRRRRAMNRLVARPVDEDERSTTASDDMLGLVGPKDRAVLFLTIVEDRERGEVARLLGCSEAAVAMRKQRALRRLRTRLDKEEPDA